MARFACMVAEFRPAVLCVAIGGGMKRILAALIIVLSQPLFAIGFGYHVFEVRTEPEFAKGIFPSSVLYQFNFPVPDFIEGSSTVLAFRLDNGLEYRTLRQDPETGAIMAQDPSAYDFPRDYTVHYDEFNLIFSQGFIETGFSDRDLLTAYGSIDGRFEMAFERLSWMTGPDRTEGVFWDSNGDYRFPADGSWIGAPELSEDRSVFQTTLSIGLRLDYMRDSTTRRDGVRAETYWRFAPSWMLLSDGSASFMLSSNTIQLSKTLYSFERPNGLGWLSIVLDDWFGYRWIAGSRVPAYIQGGEMWGPDVPNAANVFTNRLMLTFYGPQIVSEDTYPSLSIFWDLGWGLGRVLNTDTGERIAESVGSYGIRASFAIAGIAEFYYEIGCSYDPVFNEEMYVEQEFGFSVGI